MRLTEVVRHNDNASSKFFDCLCERIDGHHVQVVRRFIYNEWHVSWSIYKYCRRTQTKKQDVWSLDSELGEHDSVPETI